MDMQMIVLDLDGTVLHDNKTISNETLSVLERCRSKGILIAIATARSEKAAEKYSEKICPDSIISNGGALVRSKDEVIHQCKLPCELADTIIEELLAHKDFVSISVEAETGYYVTWEKANSDDFAHAVHYDFKTPLSQTVYKIAFELTGPELAYKLQAKYPECKMIPFSDGTWFSIAHGNVNKMNAITAAAHFFNIEVSRIAAFGDDYNDLEMIRDCGIGVAMGNAIGDIKTVADYICDSNEKDGVAKWLSEFVLQ